MHNADLHNRNKVRDITNDPYVVNNKNKVVEHDNTLVVPHDTFFKKLRKKFRGNSKK